MELVLALAIIVIMTAIVYSSLSSVVNSTAMARAAAEETRLRQFLTRSFETNFSSVYMDRTSEQGLFQFIGVNDDSMDGPMDSVRFCSSAPLMGGMSLPGDLKEVRYEAISTEDTEMGLDLDDDNEGKVDKKDDKGEEPDEGATLEAMEMPLIAGSAGQLDETLNETRSRGLEEQAQETDYEAPHWSVPIRSMDIQYFDGTDWLDEWDSLQYGRAPWCVRIRINFAKTEEQLKEEAPKRYDEVEDPDFEVVVPIPLGLGMTEDGRSLANFSGQSARDALEQLETQSSQRTGSTEGSNNNIQTEGGRR